MLGFLIFLGDMFKNATISRQNPSLFTAQTLQAERGSIISADGYSVATTAKLYKAVVNRSFIDPKKLTLFVELFSIYSGMSTKEIYTKLSAKKRHITLSNSISSKNAQYLKALSHELVKLGVFIKKKNRRGVYIRQGLDIIEHGEERVYPFGNLLTPLIGYPRVLTENNYRKIHGIKGIEKFYDEDLSSDQNGRLRSKRDVNSYLILNNEATNTEVEHGLNVKLTIPLTLQTRIEKIVDKMKKKLDAKEIMVVIMNSKNGNILSLASSNRYLPKSIKRSDYGSLNTSAIEYAFEIGSVMKPITFALLLEDRLINPYDLVNGHNGKFKVGRKTITDEHKFDWLSAENVIVHSSNIGIAQLAQKLNAIEYSDGFQRFGFTHKTEIDLPYEKRGSIPTLNQLKSETYKATTSYGYGMTATLMQLVKAYSVFNNGGKILTPKVTSSLFDDKNNIYPIETPDPVEVISPRTANQMKKILIKTVNQGTGIGTRTEGLEVGGKTGTAHIARKGRYINEYHTSFIGFANDLKRRYIIGVTVVEPQTQHFASLTAVPVFKNVVDTLVQEGYLHKSKKFKLPPYVKLEH